MNIDINDEDYQLKMTIFTALHEIFDPELGINIVDLGLVYDMLVDSKDQKIKIEMTLSTPSCPLGGFITGHVKVATLEAAPGYDVIVDLVWEPKWSYDKLTETGKAALGL